MRGAGRRAPGLRTVLVGCDVATLAAAWSVCLLPGASRARAVAAVALATATTVALARRAQLYRSSTARLRIFTYVRFAQLSAIAALALAAGDRALGLDVAPHRFVVGAAVAAAAVSAGRYCFELWVRGRRTRGLHRLRAVVVGRPSATDDLCSLLGGVPDQEFDIAAVIDVDGQEDPVAVARRVDATGAFVATTAVPVDQLNRLIREIAAAGLHVHLWDGLRGIDFRRLRMTHVAHEPFVYVSPAELSPAQLVAKRCLDVAAGAALFVLALPILTIAAAAVRLSDGGPVLFRQRRVGRRGQVFDVLKLRTMVVDAEARLAELADRNERDGPLFKVHDDPRITRVGALLRASSIDELPQLLNVLRGHMSLVGPRPALPSEVAKFDDGLASRLDVKPGVTGLWQVEARDDPSFAEYRRLDLFYVENWSLLLDMAILLDTIPAVLGRALGALRWRRAEPPEPIVVATREVGS